jgi:hypothetical protein
MGFFGWFGADDKASSRRAIGPHALMFPWKETSTSGQRLIQTVQDAAII